MKWIAKALLQGAFSRIPGGERANYLMQRRVTRNLPVDDRRLGEIVASAAAHLERVRARIAKPIGEATFYEFGAGWDLIGPLALWALGVERQVLVDIRPLVRRELIADAVARLARVDLPVRLARRPSGRLESDTVAALEREFGIAYRAPCDARATGLAAGSIDCITSHNTLEHIPRADIRAILVECRRILADGGAMSFRIDYQDHYSYFDAGVSVYNFLRFSPRAWRLLSPSLHYQNRLRHRDYLALISAAGLRLVSEERGDGDAADLDALRSMTIDKRFRGYTIEELAVRWSDLVLVKG